MKRRDFITLLGGAAATWPLAARAQQAERMRRIGVLSSLAADDPEAAARNAAFLQTLQELGWTDGRNVRIDYRWSAGNAERIRKHAGELLALAPNVVLANGTTAVVLLQQATRAVPIVFVQLTDPVGAGIVESLARPGGNATGFMNYEYGLSGKWLELLKQIAPRVTRAHPGPYRPHRDRPVRRHPVHGAVARGGDKHVISSRFSVANVAPGTIRPPFGPRANAATTRSISAVSRAWRQTGSWTRPETDRIFVDAPRRHFPGGTIKELPHHINDAAFADVCVAELAGLLSQKTRSVRHFVLFAFPATRAAPQMR